MEDHENMKKQTIPTNLHTNPHKMSHLKTSTQNEYEPLTPNADKSAAVNVPKMLM